MRPIHLGITGYRDAWERQEQAHATALAGGEEVAFYLEHRHTLTTGRRAQTARSHILATNGELQRLGVEVVESDRGGDVTYHGPGQLVCYPIVRLFDRRLSVGGYMCCLQRAAIATLATFGIEGFQHEAGPGVWCRVPHADVDGGIAKVCAVGVRVRRGVTMHGLALNVETDLSKFRLIDPCGLGRPVTSLRHLRHGAAPSIAAVRATLHARLVAELANAAAGRQAAACDNAAAAPDDPAAA